MFEKRYGLQSSSWPAHLV